MGGCPRGPPRRCGRGQGVLHLISQSEMSSTRSIPHTPSTLSTGDAQGDLRGPLTEAETSSPPYSPHTSPTLSTGDSRGGHRGPLPEAETSAGRQRKVHLEPGRSNEGVEGVWGGGVEPWPTARGPPCIWPTLRRCGGCGGRWRSTLRPSTRPSTVRQYNIAVQYSMAPHCSTVPTLGLQVSAHRGCGASTSPRVAPHFPTPLTLA